MGRIVLSRKTVNRSEAAGYPVLPGVLDLRLGGEHWRTAATKAPYGLKGEDADAAVTYQLEVLTRMVEENGPGFEPDFDTFVRECNQLIRASKYAGKPAKVRFKKGGEMYTFVAKDQNTFYVEED